MIPPCTGFEETRRVSAFSGISTSRVLLEAMKVSERNHTHIANNIANADTPGFTPVAVDFDKSLRTALSGQREIALRTSRPRHLNATRRPTEFERLALLSKNDYNKVDLDVEMSRLSENTGRYNMYAALLSKRFQVSQNILNALQR